MSVMYDSVLRGLATKLMVLCKKAGVHLSTAESCTGGMIGAILTSVPGSSEVFEGGIISYQNHLKSALLRVPERLLECVGAVSKECAEAMASGAAEAMKTELTLAVTGIAGPGGATAQKPVGLVYISCFYRGKLETSENHFLGDRDAVRTQTVEKALQMALTCLTKEREDQNGQN
ncbi:MAG: CinA family protein [Kiritimatiellia bacterium]